MLRRFLALAMEKLVRLEIMAWKKIKRIFKSKEPNDPFLKTVKIFSSQINEFIEYKMRLDTGCEIHNLITHQAVHRLQLSQEIAIRNEAICICLNGQQLISMGTLDLCWKGKSFRKIFTTRFHVIDNDFLPWEVILGAETIHEHRILKFAGFAGATIIMPKQKKGEKERIAERKREQEKKAAANIAKVNADIKAKEEAARNAQNRDSGSRN